MNLVLDRREEFKGRAGMHALLIGVSQYPYLVGGEKQNKDAERTLGQKQLSSAAMSAYKLCQWLLERRDKLKLAKLASVRLLLSPSPGEAVKVPDWRGDRATLQDVLVAANEWREDATSNKDNVTLFYFAGHGLEPKAKERALLCEDFGDGVGATLRNSLNFEDLHSGMARFKKRRGIAGTQLYFVDACRVTPPTAKIYHLKDATAAFDEDVRGPLDKDDRLASVFYATHPGDKAYAFPGEETIFNRALIDCLNGWAGVQDEVDGEWRWCITLNSLKEAISARVEQLGKPYGVTQEVKTENIDGKLVLRHLDDAPPVTLSLQVDPDAAVAETTIEIMDISRQPVKVRDEHDQLVSVPAPLKPHPFKCTLPAGYYIFNAKVPEGHPEYRNRIGPPRTVYPYQVPSKFTVSKNDEAA
jgi:hypothetical protein